MALAVRRFNEDKCSFRASALTYYSLLSVVPLVAMVFGIAKGFGLEQGMENQILAWFQGQREVAEKTIAFANSLLESTQGGIIAGIGLVVMFWTVLKVLSSIEHSFNDIWGVKRPRSLARKFSDYLSILLVCPVLLVVAGSLTVAVNSQVYLLSERFPALSVLGPAILLPMKLLPYCTIWASFIFVFTFMPNTKVSIRAALTAGIIAGTAFQLLQWAYIHFQIGVAKYGAIYGSFAALPLFMVWLQTGWMIVLFGAEISFAVQNVGAYEFEKDCREISHAHKRLLSLLITQFLVKSFCQAQGPCDAPQISKALEIPIRLVRRILFELAEVNLISEIRTKEDTKEALYQPARDVDTLTLKYVIDALEQHGSSNIPVIHSDTLTHLTDCLGEFEKLIENTSANSTLRTL
jgi:membrane protein